MIIINLPLMREFCAFHNCEYCGRKMKHGCDPAHIFSRGAGRVDWSGNLVALCRGCHHASHMGKAPKKWRLMILASRRTGIDIHELQEALWFIRRLPKETTRLKMLDALWEAGFQDTSKCIEKETKSS